MELLIRSQDKEVLVKMFDGIYYYYDEETKEHTIYNGYNNLGIYKTRERALEVLDEIQKYLVHSFTLEELNKLFDDNKNSYVYEMPKE